MNKIIRGRASGVALHTVESAARSARARRLERYSFKLGTHSFTLTRELILPKRAGKDEPPFLRDGDEIAVLWTSQKGEFFDVKNAVNITTGEKFSRGRALMACEGTFGVLCAVLALTLAGFFAWKKFDESGFNLIFGEFFGAEFSGVTSIVGGYVLPAILTLISVVIFRHKYHREIGLWALRKIARKDGRINLDAPHIRDLGGSEQ